MRNGRIRRPTRLPLFSRVVSVPGAPVHTRPYISDGTIVAPNGHLLRASAGYVIQAGAGESLTEAHYINNQALGLNAIRLGVKTTSVGRTPAQQCAIIDQVVALAAAHGQNVILLEADAAPGDWASTRPASKATSMAFWSEAAPRYKNALNVIYEQCNEPSGNGLLSDLKTAGNAPTALQNDLHDVFLTMRAGAPDTAIIMGAHANLRATGGAADYIAFKGTLDGMGGVDWSKTALGFHWYNQTEVIGLTDMSATDHGVAAMTAIKAVMPLACTETNWFVEVPVREILVNALDYLELMRIMWVLLRRPGQTTPHNSALLTDAYLDNKMLDLAAKGFIIPS